MRVYIDPVNAMFFNCLCSSIFLENSCKGYFPFLFTDCLQWSSIPMILGSVFLDGTVLGTIEQFLVRLICRTADRSTAETTEPAEPIRNLKK